MSTFDQDPSRCLVIEAGRTDRQYWVDLCRHRELHQNAMPSDRYEPGTSLEFVLRDEHNLPIAFHSTGVFDQVPLPAKAGRNEGNLVMQPDYLASGKYGFEIVSTRTANVWMNHCVDKGLRLLVERCSPDGVAFNHSQDRGDGALAAKLAGRIYSIELPPAPVALKPR